MAQPLAVRPPRPDLRDRLRVAAPPAGRAAAWLAGALLLAGLFVGRTMLPAFVGGGGVVQDDARQHVFWMLRWTDPGLFPGDLIADYFQSQATPGYAALYRLLVLATGDPLRANLLVPPVLGLLAALFAFLFVRRLHPAPGAAFLAATLLTWYVWQHDDLPSGSPRAFLLPFLAAGLWLLASGRRRAAALLAPVAAAFYPTAGVLLAALLGARLLRVEGVRPRLSTDRADWLAALAAGALVALAVLPMLLGGRFGPTVTAETARAMPEFGPGGRNAFFFPDPYRHWVESYRGGLDLRVRDVRYPAIPLLYGLAALALALPLGLAARRRPGAGGPAGATGGGESRAAGTSRDGRAGTGVAAAGVAAAGAATGGPDEGRGAGTDAGAADAHPRLAILGHLLLASFGLFFLAHLLLFRLYLPSRFVQWSLPLALAVAAGLGIALLAEALAARLRPGLGRLVRVGMPALFALGLAAHPARYDGNFVPDRQPRITAYLRAQPPETLVAGAPVEADSVPTFAGRPVLTSREYALAYQTGYYAEMKRRTEALVEAYYTDSPRRVGEIAAEYGVDVFLVNAAAYDRSRFWDAWAGDFRPYDAEIAQRLRRGREFALLDAARRCGLFTEGEVTVVPASCFPRPR